MNVKTIEIKNFKGLNSVTLEDCGAINAIVGKNNSGKSSVLHAIDMAGLALNVRGWDRFQPKLAIKDLFADVGNFAIDVALDDGASIQITANPDYGPVLSPQPTDAQRLKTVLILPDVASGMLRRQHRTPKRILQNIENRNYGEINALEMLFAIKFYSQRSERGMTPETYTTIIDEVKRYFPDIDEVESDRTEDDIATLTYSEYGRTLDILYSGTGLKHFLDVLLKTSVSGADIVLLDEPELGLHPDLQRRFVEYLSRLAKEKGIQFFLATHSQVLLNYADSISYYRITNSKGARQLASVPKTAISTLLDDLGLRPSDVLNQDICLLVEGATDVIFLEHVIRNLYSSDFEKVGVAVLQYGGSAADGIVSGAIDVSNIAPVQRYAYWLRDRDAPPSDDPSMASTKFLNALTKAGADGAILRKREIEYYLPEALLVAAQQGNAVKENAVRKLLNGAQKMKFRKGAAEAQLCVPKGRYLRKLLMTHLTDSSDLDTDIREIVEDKLILWKEEILGS
jgi:predicted ATPase